MIESKSNVLNLINHQLSEIMFHSKNLFNKENIFSKHKVSIRNDIRKSADSENVLKLHQIECWRRSCGFPHKNTVSFENNRKTYLKDVPELGSLVNVTEIRGWECDIVDVDTLSSSKSSLHKYDNLDKFAENCCPKFIQDISEESFYKNLDWERRNIIDNPCLQMYSWDNNRVHLSNCGGSHHFSAARYIARKLNISFKFRCVLKKYSLSKGAIDDLANKYILLVVNSDKFFKLYDYLAGCNIYVGQLQVSYFYRSYTLIIFPNTGSQIRRIANYLKKQGIVDFCELIYDLSG